MGTISDMIKKVRDLCVEALMTDGAHHKQWFLGEILKELGYNLKSVSRELIEEEAKEEGEDPDEYFEMYCGGNNYLWESGIPP